MSCKKLSFTFIQILFSLLFGCENQPDAAPTVVITEDEDILWLNEYFSPSEKISTETLIALSEDRTEEALNSLTTNSTEEQILSTWLLLDSEDPSRIKDAHSVIWGTNALPKDYQMYILGRISLLNDNLAKAEEYLVQIDPESPLYLKGNWALTERSLALSPNDEQTFEVLNRLAKISHPFENGDAILSALIKRTPKSVDQYPHLRELWASYPYSPITKQYSSLISNLENQGVQFEPTMSDWNQRSKQRMTAWQWKTTIAELRPIVANLTPTDSDSCAVLYAYGRSNFKINSVTKASQILPTVGTLCKDKNDDVGAKAWYLTGKSFERKKMWKQAAEAYQQIPKLYPSHSMADDGYALAGIGYQESGSPIKALQMWQSQVTQFPSGDLVGEGFWRLAWTSFLEGDTNKAIEWTREAQITVSPIGHQYQFFAFQYWEARWLVYPSATEHGKINENLENIELGIQKWKTMVKNYPTEFYSILASAQLWELETEWMSKQQFSPFPTQSGWYLSPEVSNQDGIARAAQLSNLGMIQEAAAELDNIKKQSPTNMSLYTYVLGQHDWIVAHDLLHKYIQQYPSHTWEDNHYTIQSQTYPNQYWDVLNNHKIEHPDDYTYDIRIFHALVREESSFNKDIVSWAGAKGLSQLMPATARRVASWVDLSVNDVTIFDPKTNLRIGSKYLGYLHGYFNNNPFLAVAAYNAGEGNVGKWLSKKGNLPTDMFVESIPFRETRHYVKRVLGTYQTYHMLYDRKEGTSDFPNYQMYNHKAKP